MKPSTMPMTAPHAFSLARIVKDVCLRVLFYQTVVLFHRLFLSKWWQRRDPCSPSQRCSTVLRHGSRRDLPIGVNMYIQSLYSAQLQPPGEKQRLL